MMRRSIAPCTVNHRKQYLLLKSVTSGWARACALRITMEEVSVSIRAALGRKRRRRCGCLTLVAETTYHCLDATKKAKASPLLVAVACNIEQCLRSKSNADFTRRGQRRQDTRGCAPARLHTRIPVRLKPRPTLFHLSVRPWKRLIAARAIRRLGARSRPCPYPRVSPVNEGLLAQRGGALASGRSLGGR